MKNKFKYLVSLSLKRKICTKWFVIANCLLALGIIAVTNIDSIISAFGGDFNEKQKIIIVDNTNMSYDILTQQLLLSENIDEGQESKYEFELSTKSDKELKKELKENKKTFALKIEPDDEKIIKVKLLSQEYIDFLDSQYLTNAIYNTKVMLAIEMSSISVEEIQSIYENVEIERVIYDESKNSDDENMETIMGTVFPMFILPFFMLIIFLVQMIGAEVNDEKTTRGMEIIISNVSPKTHFFSKIISGNIFIIMQSLLFLSYGAIGLFVRKIIGGDQISNGVLESVFDMLKSAGQTEFMSKLAIMLPLVLILMLLTFIAYSLLAGILASMTTNTEDFQQVQTPIMLVLLLGYYLAIMAGMFKGSLFIKICSFIPFISAILSPSLLMIGQIGLIEISIAIGFMILANFLLIKYGLRIYKVGILNYSSKDLFKKMFKAARTK